MRLPWSRPTTPAVVQEAADLRSDERVLSAAKSGTDHYLVATSFAISLMAPEDSTDGETYEMAWRIPWDSIDKAKWEPPLLELQVRSPLNGGKLDTVSVELDQETELPAIVRDRVNDSIVATNEIIVLDKTARVVARRSPESGETIWRIILGAGLDPTDPQIRKAAEEGLASYRAGLGV